MRDLPVLRLAVALGIGLALGLERERRKAQGPSRWPAGIRTFALVSLLGAVAMLFEGSALLVVGAAFVAGTAALTWFRTRGHDPGLTTEVALVLTYMLGALAMRQPMLASGLGVAVVGLLALREPLHRFSRTTLTEQEIRDGLLLAAAALVVLPIVPDRAVGPFDAINPFKVWRLVVVIMAISAGGYVALRALGPRLGLPLAGLASGFVSGAATVGAMAAHARAHAKLVRPAVAAATLATVATVIQLAVVLSATNSAVLGRLFWSLILCGATVAACGALLAWRAARDTDVGSLHLGRVVDLKTAVVFAALLTAVLLLSAFVHAKWGRTGLVIAAAAAGFVDAHSTAVSVAALAGTKRLSVDDAAFAIVVALTTNTITKAVLAWLQGTRRFAIEVSLGLLLFLSAAWLGLLL